MSTQSKFTDLNADKQILYLVQWFTEFSEFQRQDFFNDYLLPIYRKFFQKNLFINNGNDDDDDKNKIKEEENLTNNNDDENENENENLANDMNESLKITIKRPPSIFECRMKLFKEWFNEQWRDDDRIEFITRLKNIDTEFVLDFYRKLLMQQNFNNFNEFKSFINDNDNDDNCNKKRLIQRLDLLNEEIFNQKSNNNNNNDNSLDLTTINGFSNHNQNETKPDLLANCHTQQPINNDDDIDNNNDDQQQQQQQVESNELNHVSNDNNDNNNTPDLLS